MSDYRGFTICICKKDKNMLDRHVLPGDRTVRVQTCLGIHACACACVCEDATHIQRANLT